MAGATGVRIGIALGDRRAVAVVLGERGSPTAAVDLGEVVGGGGAGADPHRLLGELKTVLGEAGAGATEGARVWLVLLPPLADARVLPFPPMRRRELEAVLARDVARYFLGADRPRVVGVRVPGGKNRTGRASGGGAVPVLAAAASVASLEGVREAVLAQGWRLAAMGAAHGGWLAAALSARGTPVSAVIAVAGETAHLLVREEGDPVKVRQLPASDPAAVAQALGTGSGRVLVLGSPQAFDDLRGPLSREGWTVSRDPEGWAGAEEAAAARAPQGGVELVPPSLALERRNRARRTSTRLAGAALVLLLAAAGTHLWGAHRELAAVQARRAEIRPEVTPLLAARDSLTSLAGRVQSVDSLTRSTPVWTRSLVELAALLPQDSYLTGFFASGDTVELEAAGTRAGEAIQALRESGLFREVRLQGLVERELAEGETVSERFRLWARLPAPGEGGGS